jgi:hypothetical protein
VGGAAPGERVFDSRLHEHQLAREHVGVDRQREAGAGDHAPDHADHVARAIDHRPAADPALGLCVEQHAALTVAARVLALHREIARDARDHAFGGDPTQEAEWMAAEHDAFAAQGVAAGRETQRGRVRGLARKDHRHVDRGRDVEHVARHRLAVVELQQHHGGVTHDVTVGDDDLDARERGDPAGTAVLDRGAAGIRAEDQRGRTRGGRVGVGELVEAVRLGVSRPGERGGRDEGQREGHAHRDLRWTYLEARRA